MRKLINVSCSFILLLGATQSVHALEPSRAYPEVIEVAQSLLSEQYADDPLITQLEVRIGKFAIGDFADYSVNLSLYSPQSATSIGQCEMSLTVKKVHFAKQLPQDFILEQVVNDYQVIAKVRSMNCYENLLSGGH